MDGREWARITVHYGRKATSAGELEAAIPAL